MCHRANSIQMIVESAAVSILVAVVPALADAGVPARGKA